MNKSEIAGLGVIGTIILGSIVIGFMATLKFGIIAILIAGTVASIKNKK